MSFFCIVAWEWRVPGGVDGWTWLVECPVCLCVCVCAKYRPYPSIHQAGQTFFFFLPDSNPPPRHTHTLAQWKRWHTTSHPPASRLVADNLSPSLRDCLCVLWLFTVKWPLVLLMASYVVIILPPRKSTKKKSLCRDIQEARVTEFISDYPLCAHLEVVSEHYRNIFPFKTISVRINACMKRIEVIPNAK